MEHCSVCNGYKGERVELKEGDSCEFYLTKNNGSSVRCSVKKGKLWKVWGPDDFTVMYRKTLYRVNSVSHPDEPSPLSVALFGLCSCQEKQP